jgi:hypothetical protein
MTFLKRCWHIILIAAAIVIPSIAAFSDSTNELGQWGGRGLIAIALIGVATQVSHMWKPPTSSVARRAFSILGTVSNVAAPTLAMVYTRLPTGTKTWLYVGTAAALMSSWKGAFGAAAQPAPEAPAPAASSSPPAA